MYLLENYAILTTFEADYVACMPPTNQVSSISIQLICQNVKCNMQKYRHETVFDKRICRMYTLVI